MLSGSSLIPVLNFIPLMNIACHFKWWGHYDWSVYFKSVLRIHGIFFWFICWTGSLSKWDGILLGKITLNETNPIYNLINRWWITKLKPFQKSLYHLYFEKYDYVHYDVTCRHQQMFLPLIPSNTNLNISSIWLGVFLVFE